MNVRLPRVDQCVLLALLRTGIADSYMRAHPDHVGRDIVVVDDDGPVQLVGEHFYMSPIQGRRADR